MPGVTRRNKPLRGNVGIGQFEDFNISNPTQSDLIAYNETNGLWENTKALTGDFNITGSLTVNSIVLSEGITLGSDISATGDLDIGGNGEFDGTLIVGGAATLQSTLGVTGAATFSDAVTVAGLLTGSAGLSVNGNSTLTGDLTVSGTITGSVNLAGQDLTLNSLTAAAIESTGGIIAASGVSAASFSASGGIAAADAAFSGQAAAGSFLLDGGALLIDSNSPTNTTVTLTRFGTEYLVFEDFAVATRVNAFEAAASPAADGNYGFVAHNSTGGVQLVAVGTASTEDARIAQLDNTGLVEKNWVEFTRDAGMMLKYNGSDRLEVAAGGVNVLENTLKVEPGADQTAATTLISSVTGGVQLAAVAAAEAYDGRIGQLDTSGTLEDLWVTFFRYGAVALHFNNNQKLITTSLGAELNNNGTGDARVFDIANAANSTATAFRQTTSGGGANWRVLGSTGASSIVQLSAGGTTVEDTWITMERNGAVILGYDGTDTLRTQADEAQVQRASTWFPVPLLIEGHKNAQEQVTSSTTLQDDDDLTVTLPDAGFYAFTAFIRFNTGATAGIDLKQAFSFSGTVTNSGYAWHSTENTGSTQADRVGAITSTTVVTTPANSTTDVLIHGFLRVSTSGTFTYQWAQNVSNATALTVFFGSWLEVRRLGDA